MLPKDPVILLSYVNTMLRDEYDDLPDLCAAMDIKVDDLTERLSVIGYKYDDTTHRFI